MLNTFPLEGGGWGVSHALKIASLWPVFNPVLAAGRVGPAHLDLRPVDHAMVSDVLDGFETHVVAKDHHVVAVVPGIWNQDC